MNRVYTEYSDRGDHCTLAPYVKVKPGEKKTLRFILSWNVPNNYNYWTPYKVEKDGKTAILVANGFVESEFDGLYADAEDCLEPVTLRLRPYRDFANRGETDMLVWIPAK